MPQYKPRAIGGPFTAGLFTGLKPWIAPRDGFQTLLNAHIESGILKKRKGLEPLATTGAGYPITGIYDSYQEGKPRTLVTDTKRLYRYWPFKESLVDLSGSDVFSGYDKDRFWFDTWLDRCYMTNGKNGVYKWDVATGTFEAVDFGSTYTINTCKFIFHYKNRLLLIYVNESGTSYENRCYYTSVLGEDIAGWVQGSFQDTPITGYYGRGGVPTIVCENTIQEITYTRDTDAPFTFREVASDTGAMGPFPAPTFDRRAFLVGHAHLYTHDSYSKNIIDTKIFPFLQDMDWDSLWNVSGCRRRDRNMVYIAYPAEGSSANNRILEYNFDEDTFAIHGISAHCLGSMTGQIALQGDQLANYFNVVPENLEIADRHVLRHATYKQSVYVGTTGGALLLMNYGDDDNSAAIAATAKTVALNPFAKYGYKCKVGVIWVLVTVSSGVEITAKLYKDRGTLVWTRTIDCSGGSGTEQWVRLNGDGEVGDFFEIQFSDSAADNYWEIHGAVIFFARAGRLDGGA